MARNNFFSDTPKPSVEALPPSKESQSESQHNKNKLDNRKITRTTYSIKIDPEVRKEIKEWALINDVTISSVIETLAKLYLHRLDPRDCR